MRGLADLLSEHFALSHGWSLFIVIVVIALVIGGSAYVIIPRVAAQFDQLLKILPPAIHSWFQQIQTYDWGRWLTAHLDEFARAVLEKINLRAAFNALTDAVVVAAVIAFLGIYLSISPGMYVSGAMQLIPEDKQNRARQVFHRLGHTLRWWMIGRAIAMLAVGVLDYIAMVMLGVPLALTIAVISGVLTFIPYIGATIAMVPAVLIALTKGPQLALWVFVAKMIVQIIEGYIITPLVQRKAVHLPPALTISAQFLLGVVVGVLGLMFATPLTAIAMVLTQMLYLHQEPSD